MLISKETILQVFDNIPTINGICTQPVVTVRDVKEIIKSVPEVDAVPLDKLCKILSTNIACPQDNNHEYCLTAHCELCWKDYLTNWMEEQHGL